MYPKVLGLDLYPQQLNKIFNHPYYYGILTNRVLEGKMVEGKHEKVVPMEIFLKAHNLQKENIHGYIHKDEMP